MPPRYRLRGQASPAGPSASVVLPQVPFTDLDPTGTVTGACNDLAGALPDVPSPKEIAELPKKAANDVLNNIKDDIVSTMAAEVAKAASWLSGKTLAAITGSTTPDVTCSGSSASTPKWPRPCVRHPLLGVGGVARRLRYGFDSAVAGANPLLPFWFVADEGVAWSRYQRTVCSTASARGVARKPSSVSAREASTMNGASNS
jgi:hypothetical protein